MSENLLNTAMAAIIAKRLVKVEKAVQNVAKEAGPQGEAGERGQQGEQGDGGPQGEQGPQGERGPMPRHEWKGTALRFEQAAGTWGKYVDLKGDKGLEGRSGVIAIGGRSSGNGLSSLTPGATGVDPAGIAVQQGGQWVNLPWSAFIQIIAGAVDMGVELSRRVDFVGETIIYRGEAQPGTANSAAGWRIKRITFNPDSDIEGDIVERWVGGNADFTNVWDDRAALEYV